AAVAAAGEVPEQPGVHGPEGEFARFGPLPRPVDVVEDPLDLGPGEVGRERQADVLAQAVRTLVAGQFVDDVFGPRVLPDDRVVDRLAGLAVPDHGGLALVGDPDRGDVAGLGVGARHRPADHLARTPPDLGRVVLDPAGFRRDLLVLALVDLLDPPVLVEQDQPARRGPL